MAGAIRKAAAWIGLVDDGRYDEYETDAENTSDVFSVDDEDAEATAATPTPLPQRRDVAPPPATAKQQADLSRIVSVRPRSYNEARAIGENFRDGIPVIMNLSDMADGEDKRLVDFAAGLIFGLRGNIERVSSKVFLLCPHNLTVGPEDKERIATGGFFNQS